MKLIKSVVHGYFKKRILYIVKIDLKQRSLSDFSLPDALLAWKWSTPKSEKLKCINNSSKLKNQDYGKSKTDAWLFPAPWQISFSVWWVKAFPAAGLMLSWWKGKIRKCVCHLEYSFFNLQWSRYPLHWRNHISLNKTFINILKLSLLLSSLIISHSQWN